MSSRTASKTLTLRRCRAVDVRSIEHSACLSDTTLRSAEIDIGPVRGNRSVGQQKLRRPPPSISPCRFPVPHRCPCHPTSDEAAPSRDGLFLSPASAVPSSRTPFLSTPSARSRHPRPSAPIPAQKNNVARTAPTLSPPPSPSKGIRYRTSELSFPAPAYWSRPRLRAVLANAVVRPSGSAPLRPRVQRSDHDVLRKATDRVVCFP